MAMKFTARRFKAHPEVKLHANEVVRRLGKFYDGIVSSEVILSYERGTNSVKTAEVNLHVFGAVLSAKEKSDDFIKALDAVAEKLKVQLARYKSKLRAKDKTRVRSMKEAL